MSLLARASHGYVCRGGTGPGETVTVYVPVVVEGLIGYLVEEETPLFAPLVEEEQFASVLVDEEAPMASMADDEEPLAGVMFTEDELAGVLDEGSAVRDVVETVEVEVGFIEPEQPPLYDSRLVYWNTAAWPGASQNPNDDTILANAPEDRSTKKLEALRVYTVGTNKRPGTFVADDPVMGVPVWNFDQTQGDEIQGFQNSVGENHGNTPVEVGDTGPRWTICVVCRDDHLGTANGRRPFTFNTPRFDFFDDYPVVGQSLWIPGGYNAASVYVETPANNCYMALITSFGDGTTQMWVNGVWGERVAGYPQSLGASYWMGTYTTQASSWQGAIHAVYAWDDVVDPIADGVADYVKRQVPGVFDFSDPTPDNPPPLDPAQWWSPSLHSNFSDGDRVEALINFGRNLGSGLYVNGVDEEPTYVADAINGLPSIRFAPTQSLQTAFNFPAYGSTALTVGLIKRTSTTGVGFVDRSYSGTRMVLYERLAGKWTQYTTVNRDTDAPALPDQWDVISAFWDGTEGWIRVNGVQYASGPCDPTGAINRAFNTFSPDEWELAEWVEYDGGVTDLTDPVAVAVSVEAWINAKYGPS